MKRSGFKRKGWGAKGVKKKTSKKIPVQNKKMLGKKVEKKKKKIGLPESMKLTKEFKEAFNRMEKTEDHIFLTGRAGTGKSTLLNYFRHNTDKKHVVLAPTGVAALNVKGQTIHSFFGFHTQIQPSTVRRAKEEKLSLFKNLETIVIDEISMVRADLLDCIDRALRLNRKKNEPFGGVQMIFIGDLFQLPPVVTRDEEYRFQGEYYSPYFFSAHVMNQIELTKIELTKVHRQKNEAFVKLLERIRTNVCTEEDMSLWNRRHDPFFDPTEEEGFIHLTTTNKMAKARNDFELKRLDGEPLKLRARVEGQLPDRRMPSEDVIEIKEGARIMFTVNDPERRFVNGTLGTVVEIKKSIISRDPILVVQMEDGEGVDVKPHAWELFEYQEGADGNIQQSVIGVYTQYPVALAWAVTIHKSQGKTFDKILIDLGWGAFAHGQTYVALSRCTEFSGITLQKPLQKKDIILDEAVLNFME